MELRCPFCHDTFEPGAGVACWSCGAGHHADCFLESRGCAASACGDDRVRVGAADVGLEELARLKAEPGALEELARRSEVRASARSLAWRLVVLVAVVALVPAAYGALGEVGLLLWGLLLVAILLATGPPRRSAGARRVARPDEPTFDPIFGTWRSGPWTAGVLPDHGESLREGLRRSDEAAAPPALEGPPPERCPHCEEALEWDPDEPPAAFCYHCGGSLAPEPEDRDPSQVPDVEGGK